MSKVVPFCVGIAAGLSISQNFNHKICWKTEINNSQWKFSYPLLKKSDGNS